jgi:hypothetical protein
MKNFLIYDNNLEQIAARIQAESAQMICNPYSSLQYQRIEVPAEIALDVAGLDQNLQPILDQYLQDARTLSEREAKLDQLRSSRSEKLTRCDQLVNIAFLNSWTAGEKTELKNYRLALLDVTEVFKADMSLVDALNVSTFVWPTEPTEV